MQTFDLQIVLRSTMLLVASGWSEHVAGSIGGSEIQFANWNENLDRIFLENSNIYAILITSMLINFRKKFNVQRMCSPLEHAKTAQFLRSLLKATDFSETLQVLELW